MKRQFAEPANIVRLWDIEGDGGPATYFFGADKHLYRVDSRGRYIVSKRQQKRYTQGYILKSRFYSLSQLRLLLHRHVAINGPVGF